MIAATDAAGVKLMYAENWVYAPAIARADRLLAAAGGTILELRGGECHSGSHSPYSKEWRFTGGGALLRLGVHPIGAMLHLKRQEALRRGQAPVRPRSVMAEVGDLTRSPAFQAEARHWVGTGWVDVENWGSIIITFDDGSRGIVWASDAVLGGMESSLQVLASNAHIKCRLSHTGQVEAYTPDASILAGEYLHEKLETTAGWSPPDADEDWAHGHPQAAQDFVALCGGTGAPTTGRRPARSRRNRGDLRQLCFGGRGSAGGADERARTDRRARDPAHRIGAAQRRTKPSDQVHGRYLARAAVD